MALTAKSEGDTGKSYDPIPEDTYQAICYAIYDLGTQYNQIFDSMSHKVLVCWEIPEVRIEFEKDGEQVNLPRAISKEFTLSLHPKSNLYATLVNWRGKDFTPQELFGFDIEKLLGANCMLQVIHKKSKDGKKVYANVGTVSKLYKSIEPLKAENKLRSFSFEDGGSPPEDTPEWILKKIQAAQEWGGATEQDVREVFTHADEDIPLDAYEDDVPF